MNEQAVIYSVYVGIDWADSKHDVCICLHNLRRHITIFMFENISKIARISQSSFRGLN